MASGVESRYRANHFSKAARGAHDEIESEHRKPALLRMILRKAYREWDWIDKVPAVPIVQLETREPRFLNRAQFKGAVAQAVDAPEPLAEFSIETGLRMRNVTGLTWVQVDLRRRMLVIPAARAKAGETIAVPLSAAAAES
jgi:integrase